MLKLELKNNKYVRYLYCLEITSDTEQKINRIIRTVNLLLFNILKLIVFFTYDEFSLRTYIRRYCDWGNYKIVRKIGHVPATCQSVWNSCFFIYLLCLWHAWMKLVDSKIIFISLWGSSTKTTGNKTNNNEERCAPYANVFDDGFGHHNCCGGCEGRGMSFVNV